MDKAEREILNVTKSASNEFKSSRDVVSNVMQELMKLRSTGGTSTGVKTGYTDLECVTNGFQRGDFVSSCPSAMGKTAFALNLALNASFYNSGASIFSLKKVQQKRYFKCEIRHTI